MNLENESGEITDDRLVHEGVFAAEAFVHAMRAANLPVCAVDSFINLIGWAQITRNEWQRRDRERKANCEHAWEDTSSHDSMCMTLQCRKCGSDKAKYQVF